MVRKVSWVTKVLQWYLWVKQIIILLTVIAGGTQLLKKSPNLVMSFGSTECSIRIKSMIK